VKAAGRTLPLVLSVGRKVAVVEAPLAQPFALRPSTPLRYFGSFRDPRNGSSMSRGSGKMMVLVFSVEISMSVCM
jgi:hypothetical protein